MTNNPVVLIAGQEALAEFRQRLTGEYGLQLLEQAQGRLLIDLPVGVGKSQWLRLIAVAALRTYDLVVVLVPRRDILHELERELQDVPRYVFRPRPRRRCGQLNEQWRVYERSNCGLLGRQEICAACPLQSNCPWPDQHAHLSGMRLILATQAQLEVNPFFVRQLQLETRAERVLLLADESDLLLKRAERVLRREKLIRFRDVVAEVAANQESAALRRYLEHLHILLSARTDDLQSGQWRFPHLPRESAIAIQQTGRRQYGDEFNYLAYELRHFTYSDRASRKRLDGGDIRYAVLPWLGDQFIVFSGSIARELARYRLDPNHRQPVLCSPFSSHQFEHLGTRWYNIASMEAAAMFFSRNASRILDFFAGKIAANVRAGKRTLLVARKQFCQQCARHLQDRLQSLGFANINVVTRQWERADLSDPSTLPLINYGVSGVNLFEGFDAAYCLTGYYVAQRVVARAVHDIDGEDPSSSVSIVQRWDPPRRIARVETSNGQATILPQIAQGVLQQKEADVVVQAVGRVRPFTRPREIITFQADRLPGVRCHLRFKSLAHAREHFGIGTRRSSEADSLAAEARRLHAAGQSRQEIAAALNRSVRTISRYLATDT